MLLSNPKKLICVAISLVVAAAHIWGPDHQAQDVWLRLYSSYFSDVSLPFSLYFLLCVSEVSFPRLRPWWIKSVLVFGSAAAAEGVQFFGIDALGATFDPLDFAAYASGVLMAATLERGVFARRLSFWN